MILVVPLIAVLLVFAALNTRAGWLVEEEFQEFIGPAIVAFGLWLSMMSTALRKRLIDVWFVGLFASLLCRELHFVGTSTGIYIALIVLFVSGSILRERLPEFYQRSLPISLLVGGFSTYAIAVTIDAAWWRFLPEFRMWRVQVEETLESTGHLLILAAVIAVIAQRSYADSITKR
ncbi:MAG: hypothetical protein CMJ78_17475 [Planctomycetaceae bacterium]|nr:hypothetical protein [Planctomycetaceae bacterium]